MSSPRERILAALEAERDMYAREVGAIGIEIVSAAIDIVERELTESDAERLQKEDTKLREALEAMVEMVEMNGFGKAYALDNARIALNEHKAPAMRSKALEDNQ